MPAGFFGKPEHFFFFSVKDTPAHGRVPRCCFAHCGMQRRPCRSAACHGVGLPHCHTRVCVSQTEAEARDGAKFAGALEISHAECAKTEERVRELQDELYKAQTANASAIQVQKAWDNQIAQLKSELAQRDAAVLKVEQKAEVPLLRQALG